MQRDVRVYSVEARGGRRHQAEHGRKGTVAEAGKTEVEPGHLRLYFPDGAPEGCQVAILSESPAAIHLKARQFFRRGLKVVPQHRQINPTLLPKLIRDMETVLVERMTTGRKRRDERNLHGSLERSTRSRERRPRRCR